MRLILGVIVCLVAAACSQPSGCGDEMEQVLMCKDYNTLLLCLGSECRCWVG